MKTIEYKSRVYDGEKVAIPAKYSRMAKGIVKEVMKAKDELGLAGVLIEDDKSKYNSKINTSVLNLFNYKISVDSGKVPYSKFELNKLKENLYLTICKDAIDGRRIKKTRKIKKKSEEDIRKMDRKHKEMEESVLKLIKDL
jgi:hypothetical protein